MSAPVDQRRQLRQEDVKCLAGEVVGDDGVLCKIEDNVLRVRTEPSSLLCFCLGEPTMCPTLQKDKDGERLDKQQATAAVARSDRKAQKAGREERILHAKELLESDSPEGAQFRRRIAKILQRSDVQQRLRAAGARDTPSGLILPPGVRR